MDPRRDPCEYLPAELMLAVFGYLDRRDLASCLRVSKDWGAVAVRDSLWRALCVREWSDKVYVPAHIRALVDEGKAWEALKLSLEDSKRTYLTEEELCSFTWCFRFKSDAGFDWIVFDPWWNNKPAATRRFLPSGEMIVTNRNDLPYGHWQFRWRFARTSGSLRGPLGSFVKVNNFPSYVVGRYKNWGFTMESCWCFLTGFPMPAPGECEELEDTNLRVSYEIQRAEANAYNILPHPDIEESEEEGGEEFDPEVEGQFSDSEEGEEEEEEEGEEEEDQQVHVQVHVQVQVQGEQQLDGDQQVQVLGVQAQGEAEREDQS